MFSGVAFGSSGSVSLIPADGWLVGWLVGLVFLQLLYCHKNTRGLTKWLDNLL